VDKEEPEGPDDEEMVRPLSDGVGFDKEEEEKT